MFIIGALCEIGPPIESLFTRFERVQVEVPRISRVVTTDEVEAPRADMHTRVSSPDERLPYR